MHIVHRTFGYRFSGITHSLCSLLSGWRDRDVTLDLWGTDVRPVNMNSGNLDYQLPEGKHLWAGATATGRLGRSRAAVRLLATLVSRRKDFDLAHFHSLEWGELLSPVILHRLGKKAVFTTSLFGSDNPGAIAAAHGGTLALNLYRQFDGIVAVSPALAEDCREHGISNVLCLPYFLAIPELKDGRNLSLREVVRSRHQIPAEDAVLLFIGSAIRRKGFDILIESYIRVARVHPNTWLVLVGPSSTGELASIEPSYLDEQRSRLLSAHVSDRVIWTGTVTDKHELVGYYSAADIFVFPTRAEGLPNVLIEAMAAGLPVVATHLPGSTDSQVVDGETGFLVPSDDVSALASAVERLLSEPSLRTSMSRSARIRSRLFSFESYCLKLKDFYLSVMGSQS
jgi:glycosyltransferase involved in cell wall biosynthesis